MTHHDAEGQNPNTEQSGFKDTGKTGFADNWKDSRLALERTRYRRYSVPGLMSRVVLVPTRVTAYVKIWKINPGMFLRSKST